MSGKFRDCIRAVAKLTSDDELRRVAELPEVPVSLENCRQLDPQTWNLIRDQPTSDSAGPMSRLVLPW
jgi:hypothetical protein